MLSDCTVICSRHGKSNITYGETYSAVRANNINNPNESTSFFIIDDKEEGEVVSGFYFLYYYNNNYSFKEAIEWLIEDKHGTGVIFIPMEMRIYREGDLFVVSYAKGGEKRFQDINNIEVKISLINQEWLICRTNPLSHK